MITISVRGLPKSTTERSITELFSAHGVVRSLKLSTDLFSGQCRGFAEVKMEGHEARNAIAALNGKDVDGSTLRVEVERKRKGGPKGRR